jgi:hypothetical protein
VPLHWLMAAAAAAAVTVDKGVGGAERADGGAGVPRAKRSGVTEAGGAITGAESGEARTGIDTAAAVVAAATTTAAVTSKGVKEGAAVVMTVLAAGPGGTGLVLTAGAVAALSVVSRRFQV